MKTKYTYLLLAFVLIISSCKKTIEKKEKQHLRNENKLDTLQQSKTKNTLFDINTTIAEGIVYRAGENNNWTTVFATNIFGFKNAPAIGDFAQVIPLRKGLTTLELKIKKVIKRNDVDDEDPKHDWFEVTFENIKNKDYWTVKSPEGIRSEYPSELVVIYPPIKDCKLLEIATIDSLHIPKNTSKKSIKAVLDFNNDNLPDAFIFNFCCDDRNSNKNCEYQCGETYLKLNNKWKLINSSKPL